MPDMGQALHPRASRLFGLAATLLLASLATAQDAATDTLTLAEALELARIRNGDVRAAALDASASRERVVQSRAAFLPTITPSYVYNSDRREVDESVFTRSEGSQTQVNARMRLLDLGERGYSLKATQESASASRATSLQTLRTVLFNVHGQYYDTLRAEELVRVAQSQVQRAQKVLEQTQAQVEVGETARKDILQAQADLANARVQELQARNRLSAARATLKATIGWETAEPLPPLVASVPPTEFAALPPLAALVEQGLRDRADLLASRKRTSGQRYSSLRADRESQVSLAVDANFDQQLTPDNLESRALTLNVSLPWLDGGRSRAAAKEARLGLEASRSQLAQQEREARSEIETAYQEVTQNADRVKASQAALEAARLNYEAASESQRLGAGTILDVITAQVSLVTAESNFVEALYDYQTSEVRLRLATGQPIPGEKPI